MTSEDNILLLVMGLPCSGKTTYILKRFPPPVPLEVEVLDEKKLLNLGRIIRYLHAVAWEKKEIAVVEGVFSDLRSRRKLVEWAYTHEYTPHCVVVDTAVDICLERNAVREKDMRVTTGSIKKAGREMTIPSVYEGFASVKREYGNGEAFVQT